MQPENLTYSFWLGKLISRVSSTVDNAGFHTSSTLSSYFNRILKIFLLKLFFILIIKSFKTLALLIVTLCSSVQLPDLEIKN